MRTQQLKDKKIDRYYFLFADLLGSGSFAQVYKGINMLTREQVAIKMIDKQTTNRNDYLRQGLIAEIRIMQTLKSECVVRLLDVLETGNNYYLIQEYCDGGNLQTLLSKKRTLPESDAMLFLTDTLTGFIELIKNGVVHRDLKPANILVHQGRYKIADFGFAKVVADFHKDMLASAVGTPLYMSPQILQNDKYTNKTDIWSLGFILYQTLYYKPPWNGVSIPQLLGNIRKQPLSFPENPSVSQDLKDLITGCLQVDEQERLSWDQIFQHKAVEKQFSFLYQKEDNIVNNSVYLRNDIRQKLMQDNINILEIIDKLGITDQFLSYNQFKTLILEIDPSTHEGDLKKLFMQMTKEKNISVEQIKSFFFKQAQQNEKERLQSNNQNDNPVIENLPHLQQGGGPYQYGQQIPIAYLKLQNEIKKQKINVEEFLRDHFPKELGYIMSNEDFYNVVKKIDENLTDQEIEQAFIYMENHSNIQLTTSSFIENLKLILMKISQPSVPDEREGTQKNSWGQTNINKPKSNSGNFKFWQKKVNDK